MPDSKNELHEAWSARNAGNGLDLSLVRDDVIFRAQRQIGLISGPSMSALRRALFFAAVSWLPVAIWAVVTGRAWEGTGDASFAAHFGLHVRCLFAIPLMILAEEIANDAVPAFLRRCVEMGIVTAEATAEFRARIADVGRLRSRALPWVVIIGATLAWSTIGAIFTRTEDVAWGHTPAGLNDITFAGWWFLLVIRPLFVILLLAWLWRAFLLFVLLLRIAGMPLSLVPTHPDRAGGLSFVERLAFMFSPVALAISSAAAASFAHDVVYHGVNPLDMKALLLTSALLASVVFLIPFVPLCVALGRLKRRALLEYASLVAHHDRLVHLRWIHGRDIGTPQILDAPELGPVADIHAVYDAVNATRWIPVSRVAIAAVAIPAVVPMLCVVLLQVPLATILGKAIKTLI
ncbi:hypothetical protein [Paraburkholderia sp. J76]|uniref:hypothetical protein n=1 Tax=Paraburkholderia sp. J76 TaxID=2805439 RepID=UPI002ABDAD42|nr:hypothetical protein [Paraburkholderia sp. J76]